MWRKNSGLFLLGFGFVVLCMVAVWAVRSGDAPLPPGPRAAQPPPEPEAPGRSPGPTVGANVTEDRAARVSPRVALPPRRIPGATRDEQLALEEAVRSALPAGEREPRGLVDHEQIRAAVTAARPLWTGCFRDQQARYPGPHRALLRFTLTGAGAEGRFADGQVLESSLVDPYLEACLIDALEDARYTAPSGASEVVVRYPFRFPGDGAP